MTDIDNARQDAASWAETIAKMIRALENSVNESDDQGCDLGEAYENAQTAITDSPLSVEVRSGWYAPGMASEPVEYQILLSWGGPSVRITGQLGGYGKPDTADLEYQDWGTPWTRYHPAYGEPLFDSHNADVLTFAQQFYFGE